MGSTKRFLKQFKVITAGAMASTNTLTSAVTDITGLDNVGFQFDWTGSPTGTFQIQVSANYNQNDASNGSPTLNAGTWVPVVVTYWNGSAYVTSTTIPTSVGSPIYVDCTQLSAPYIRCTYTNISSSGTLTSAIVTGKSI
jgi:hypothetical protein